MREKEKDFTVTINRSSKSGDIPSMVVEQFVSLISQKILKPGDKLPSELEMTRRFNISRISLRESMKLLEAKGYIVSKGRKGKFICPVSDIHLSRQLMEMVHADRNNLNNIFDVKKTLTGEASVMAAVEASAGDIAQLNAIIQDLKELSAASSACSPEKCIEQYAMFFSILEGTLKNTVLSHLNITLSHVLYNSLQPEAIALIGDKGCREQLIGQLEQITAALEKRSSEDTKNAIHAHIDLLKSQLLHA